MENVTDRDDKFARESFSFRRMARWQVWSISIASAAVFILLVGYVIGL